ncbi:MAG: substrate-binding domain-containing protein [Boseongicola sp.]|nr:substrate-binding domain-containing protein [Boseongicola sp.]
MIRPSTILALAFTLIYATAVSAESVVRMAVTTSFHNSGLSDVLVPLIGEDTGIEVQLIVVGTGQALRLGEAGDVDAVLVHSRAAEDKFVAAGFGTHRREIMYNDFVIVGPSTDPAGVLAAEVIETALSGISTSKSVFVSRGDDSGTHKRELSLWSKIGVDVSGSWYRELGSGMGATLNTASAMNAYTLTDRASWLNFGNKRELRIVFEGDPELFNQYVFIPVNPDRHPHVNSDGVRLVEEWLVSAKGQTTIGSYMIDGQTLFVPNAQGNDSSD